MFLSPLGTHIHHGDFIAGFPLIPGHEVCGTVAAVGKDVTGFEHGERVVADPSVVVSICRPFCTITAQIASAVRQLLLLPQRAATTVRELSRTRV